MFRLKLKIIFDGNLVGWDYTKSVTLFALSEPSSSSGITDVMKISISKSICLLARGINYEKNKCFPLMPLPVPKRKVVLPTGKYA